MGNSKIRIIMVLITLILLFVAAGCGRVVTREQILETYQVRPGTALSVSNLNGSVSITGWEENKVEIKIIKESLGGQEALDQVDINIDISDIMLIHTLFPEGNKRVIVNYEIKVPIDLLVSEINCSNGNISISGVTGSPQASTSNGTINIENVNGMVTAGSSNGDITVKGARSLGSLESSNGNITADLNFLHENVNIQTSNGSINLAILPTLEMTIDASTSNGKISVTNLNLDLTVHENTRLSGTLNGGGNTVQLETSNGSIELVPLK